MTVGYGTYLPPGGCPDALPITAEEADYLQGLIDHLSDVIEEVAEAEDVTFVDMRDIPGAVDHTACAAPDQQWIRAINTYGDGAPLHPSSAGMACHGQPASCRHRQVWATDPVHPIPAPPPSPTPSPTPAPTLSDADAGAHGDGDGRSDAALEARAIEALSRVRFNAWCRVAPGASGPTVKLKVRHGLGLVDRVVFATGRKGGVVDRKSPFLLERRPSALSGLHGRVHVAVTVRVGDLTKAKSFSARRPYCLR